MGPCMCVVFRIELEGSAKHIKRRKKTDSRRNTSLEKDVQNLWVERLYAVCHSGLFFCLCRLIFLCSVFLVFLLCSYLTFEEMSMTLLRYSVTMIMFP